MNQNIKGLFKRIVPASFIRRVRVFLNIRKIKRAKKIFNNAGTSPSWLEWNDLEYLQSKYTHHSEYGYDSDSIIKRGEERVKVIRKLIPFDKIITVLELGCGDGMVSCILQRNGKKVTAIDHCSERFDERVKNEGVKLLELNASSLPFKDESFDFVFSFDAFEHFADPESVLNEAYRVVKKGGYIYMNFGSPYMSPKGLHAYGSVTVPYCEVLFNEEMLKEYIMKNHLPKIDFNFVNGWTLEKFRKLWINFSDRLNLIKNIEIPTYEHLDLIEKYPSCFKSKTSYFDNFIISAIEVLFVKL